MTKRIAIIGAGAFGTALGTMLSNAGQDVVLWSRDPNEALAINQSHTHPTRLSGLALPESLRATSDLPAALSSASLVISALPLAALRDVWSRAAAYLLQNTIVVSTSKGIEPGTLQFAYDILAEILPAERLACLTGPSFAYELATGLPTSVVVAASQPDVATAVQKHMSHGAFRVYTSADVIGVEVGGALKNVVAIACGAADGLRLGANAKAALMTRGIDELKRLAMAMGGQPETLAGLAGMGDLVLTCTGGLSRNRLVGERLAGGASLQEVLHDVGETAEGVGTARAVRALQEKYGVELPICDAVYRVLFGGEGLCDVVRALLGRGHILTP